jgi:hypothetical protein
MSEEMNVNEDLAELDRDRIEEITTSILLVIRENYVRGPTSRDRCFEALNALAASAALVIEGSDGPGGEAQKFFEQALRQHGVVAAIQEGLKALDEGRIVAHEEVKARFTPLAADGR